VSLVLILRPAPGGEETAARARAMGLEPVAAALFTVRPVAWHMPNRPFDALLLTSANGARHGLRPELSHLPCYAVGEATARAARAAGSSDVRTGSSDGAAAMEMMGRAGVKHALHLCGREHIASAHPALSIERRVVYAAEAAEALPVGVEAALERGALVLVHSPRAGAVLGSLVRQRADLRIAAISGAAAQAAGTGWRDVQVAAEPRDQALLELAARLCKTDAS